jgi:hypothetical protein
VHECPLQNAATPLLPALLQVIYEEQILDPLLQNPEKQSYVVVHANSSQKETVLEAAPLLQAVGEHLLIALFVLQLNVKQSELVVQLVPEQKEYSPDVPLAHGEVEHLLAPLLKLQ